METAKVDMRRLQLLNDRIAQVMDALNQVRFSVHGLQHSGPTLPFSPFHQPVGFGFPQFGYPTQNIGFAQGLNTPAYPQTWGVNPAGLGHTPFEALDPTAAWRMGGLDPFTAAGRLDPIIAQRLAQTFPYAYSTVSPIAIG